jgi:hypothetical protein
VKAMTTKEEIMKAIKECAAELGHAPKIVELIKMRPINRGCIYRRFGNYRDALAACGMEGSGPGYQTELQCLFLDWAGVVRKLGRLPTMSEFDVHGKYSAQPLLKRYRKWSEVAAGLQDYARETGLETEWSDVMDAILRRQSSVRKPVWRPATPGTGVMEDQPVYGTPMTAGPLTFAPTHEGGVLFLFGAMARELGFVVLRIQPGFPDCEAMREVRPGVWQRKLIECEFESRNFLAHGHAVTGCDMIVCWNHNWEDCPLEVVELRSKIGGSGHREIG